MNEDLEEDSSEDVECDHEWEFQDDSFGHEYGTEIIQYWMCRHCGETRSLEALGDDDI